MTRESQRTIEDMPVDFNIDKDEFVIMRATTTALNLKTDETPFYVVEHDQ